MTRDMFFNAERFETSELDEFASHLIMRIGVNAAPDEDGVSGKIPQLEIDVLDRKGTIQSTFWINFEKIDEVITMLAYAKHRITEETGYGKV